MVVVTVGTLDHVDLAVRVRLVPALDVIVNFRKLLLDILSNAAKCEHAFGLTLSSCRVPEAL